MITQIVKDSCGLVTQRWHAPSFQPRSCGHRLGSARWAQLCSLWPPRNEDDPPALGLWPEEEAEGRTSGQDKQVQSQAWEWVRGSNDGRVPSCLWSCDSVTLVRLCENLCLTIWLRDYGRMCMTFGTTVGLNVLKKNQWASLRWSSCERGRKYQCGVLRAKCRGHFKKFVLSCPVMVFGQLGQAAINYVESGISPGSPGPCLQRQH